MTETPLDLNAIKARDEGVLDGTRVADPKLVRLIAVDVPALVAEVERLHAEVQRAAISTLEQAHAEARLNTRRAWDECDDNDMARHWSGVAGWLRTAIRKLQLDEEPYWPDASTVSFAAATAPRGTYQTWRDSGEHP